MSGRAKALLECSLCHHAWGVSKVPKGYVPCPSCGKFIAFYQTPTFFNLSDVAPGIERIFEAARDLAHAEQTRRDYVGAVDWSRCERGYEDGRSACTQEAESFVPPVDDLFATHERCAACQRNRDLLTGAQSMKVARRNAINRIVRAVARMTAAQGKEGATV